MPAFFFIAGLILCALGALGFFSGPTVTQEIAGAGVFTSGCVLLAAGAIVQAIDQLRATIVSQAKKDHPPAG